MVERRAIVNSSRTVHRNFSYKVHQSAMGGTKFLIGIVLPGILPAVPAFSQTVALAIHLQNMDLMRQAIEK
jgi:hypothetical protein